MRRKLADYPVVDGRRFEDRDEHFVYHGFGVWPVGATEPAERMCFTKDQQRAKMIVEALEQKANSETPTEVIEVRL